MSNVTSFEQEGELFDSIEMGGIDAELDSTTEDTIKDNPNVPEKFKGKNLEDVVKSYQELEKERSRQANEIGELRRLTDRLLDLELKSKGKTVEVEKPVVTEQDFYSDPFNAVNSVVEDNPTIKKLKEDAVLQKRQEAQRLFVEKHPDYQSIASDSEFTKWIAASPIRTDLYSRGDNYDFQAADELFSSWKELQTLRGASKDKAVEKVKRDKELKDATTESSSSNSQGTSKKYLRREDIIRLRIENPSKYAAMQSEITRAYMEDRVR